MTQSITFHPTNFSIMNKKTSEIRYQELVRDVKNHPHRDELIEIMQQQVADDTTTLRSA